MKIWMGVLIDHDGDPHLFGSSSEDEMYRSLWDTKLQPLLMECHCDSYVGFECGNHGATLEERRNWPTSLGIKAACLKYLRDLDPDLRWESKDVNVRTPRRSI